MPKKGSKKMLEKITNQSKKVITELIETAKLHEGDLVVIGCSSSEIGGYKIGSHSAYDIALAVFEGIYPILKEHKIDIACQCCEHLNRALIVEREVALKHGFEIVSVVPKPKAGGSWATSAYENLTDPVAVEFIKADAGLDIGSTLIGMHLKHVAVPVRLFNNRIGEAPVTAARTRPKYIGGPRAQYE